MTARLPPAREALPADLKAFFDTYREAFNRLDGAAVARLYAVPSGIASDRGYTHWPAFEPIRDNMDALCALYREHGFAASHFDIAAFIPQGNDHAVADLAWTIERTDGQDAWCFHTTYNLVRRGRGWRVLLCTAYQEEALAPKDEAPADAQATLGLTIAAPPAVLEAVVAAAAESSGPAVADADAPASSVPDAAPEAPRPVYAPAHADEDMPIAEPPAEAGSAQPFAQASDALSLGDGEPLAATGGGGRSTAHAPDDAAPATDQARPVQPPAGDPDTPARAFAGADRASRADADAGADAVDRVQASADAAPPGSVLALPEREPGGSGRDRRPRRGRRGTTGAGEGSASAVLEQGPAQAVLPMDTGPDALQAGRADAPKAKPKPRRPRARPTEAVEDSQAPGADAIAAEAGGSSTPPAGARRKPARTDDAPAAGAEVAGSAAQVTEPQSLAKPDLRAEAQASGSGEADAAAAKPRSRRRRPTKAKASAAADQAGASGDGGS